MRTSWLPPSGGRTAEVSARRPVKADVLINVSAPASCGESGKAAVDRQRQSLKKNGGQRHTRDHRCGSEHPKQRNQSTRAEYPGQVNKNHVTEA